jgi:hypothetical protein
MELVLGKLRLHILQGLGLSGVRLGEKASELLAKLEGPSSLAWLALWAEVCTWEPFSVDTSHPLDCKDRSDAYM